MLRKKQKSRKNSRECLLALVQKNKKTNALNNRIKKKCEVLAKAYDASLKESNKLKMNLDFKEYARDFWEQKCRIVKQDYESLEQKYNDIKYDKDLLEQSYGKLKHNYYKSLEENNEKIKCEYDSLEQNNDSLLEDYDKMKENCEFWGHKYNEIKCDKESLEKKYYNLTCKLRKQVECPICLEVPISGPVHTCPNGHFVCHNCKCKTTICPTCRDRTLTGKSMLALTVMDNIEHYCKFENCEKILPLEEYKSHLQFCVQRIVECPAPKAMCGKKMALSKVFNHNLTECQGSFNVTLNNVLNTGKYPLSISCNTQRGPLKGIALNWKDVQFYLNIEKFQQNCHTFSLQLFGNYLQCEDYEVSISVGAYSASLKKKCIQKFTGEPLPIDMDGNMRKENGFFIGTVHMEKIIAASTKHDFHVSIDIKKCL